MELAAAAPTSQLQTFSLATYSLPYSFDLLQKLLLDEKKSHWAKHEYGIAQVFCSTLARNYVICALSDKSQGADCSYDITVRDHKYAFPL